MQIKATERAEAKTKEWMDMEAEKERNITALQAEIQGYKEEVQRLRKAIFQLEKDRERLGNEVGEQRNNFVQAQEDIKLKDISIGELKKRVTEWEGKLKQQHQLYEAVRADRNHYSKGLLESQDEIAELRKKFKIMGHQIEQLKEEISSKDSAIVKEHFEYQRAEKLMEATQSRLERTEKALSSSHELVRQQENELKNLTSTLRRMDEEALAQRKEYDQVGIGDKFFGNGFFIYFSLSLPVRNMVVFVVVVVFVVAFPRSVWLILYLNESNPHHMNR